MKPGDDFESVPAEAQLVRVLSAAMCNYGHRTPTQAKVARPLVVRALNAFLTKTVGRHLDETATLIAREAIKELERRDFFAKFITAIMFFTKLLRSQRPASGLVRPPGSRLVAFAEFFFSRKTYSTVIEP